ncbi:hypothetical protein M011DRAFT_375878, partial [Sporormia fimetaria CBS 119925]
MDRASQVLAQSLPRGASRTYAALAERGNQLAQNQQYLTPEEEKAVVKFLLLMSSLGHPVRIKFIPSLAFSVARRRSTNKPIKPPGKNWPRAFEKRHPELNARRVKAIDWKRHDKNIHEKV